MVGVRDIEEKMRLRRLARIFPMFARGRIVIRVLRVGILVKPTEGAAENPSHV